MTPTQPPKSLEDLLTELTQAIIALSATVADPSTILINALSPKQAAGSSNPTGHKTHANSDLIARLLAATSDTYGRVSTGDLVTSATGAPILTLTSAAQDYVIQVPTHFKTAIFRAEPPSGGAVQTNNILAYWSTGVISQPLNMAGLAYDPASKNDGARAGYVGMPMRPSIEYLINLSDQAGALHFASPLASTVIVCGFLS